MTGGVPSRYPGRGERWALVALLILSIGFGAITLARSAFMHSRHTDADVYFRAAWAIRAGADPYRVTDTHQWHYHYPPLLAILLVPLADPPEDAPPGTESAPISYPLAVALWYLLNLVMLGWASHGLASAIETSSSQPVYRDIRPFERRWWQGRLLPLLICLPTVGYSLGRGQVNSLLLLSLCGMSAALLRRRPLRAGVWLALGACVKPYLAVLLLYPLIRHDWRFFRGFGLGALLGLVLIPVLALGPARTADLYRSFYELRLAGLVTGQMHGDIEAELNPLRGQFPTYGLALFKALHPDPGQWPEQIPPAYRRFELALGGTLLLLTLGVIRRATRVAQALSAPPRIAGPGGAGRLMDILAPGALLLVLLPAIPTCKPHYYLLAVLPVMGLLAVLGERRGGPGVARLWWLGFALYGGANGLSELVQVQFLHAGGMAPIASLLLWLVCVVQMLGLRQRGKEWTPQA